MDRSRLSGVFVFVRPGPATMLEIRLNKALFSMIIGRLGRVVRLFAVGALIAQQSFRDGIGALFPIVNAHA